MMKLGPVTTCAGVFFALKFATDLYHGSVYGVPMSLASLVVNALIIGVIGGLGFVSGALRLDRPPGSRVAVYIAIVGYFASYSLAYLLQSMLSASWTFLVGIYLVTLLVTLRLGPKWDRREGA